MSDITEERLNLQIEETIYQSSISESLLTRVGASINFINKRQYDTKAFHINGPYSVAISFNQGQGVDGAHFILFDCEIIGVMAYNLKAGTSGVTTLDIRRFTGSNTPSGGTSIFSTKPSFNITAQNNSYVGYRQTDSTILENPAGTVLPVLSTTQLNAGDLITANIDSAMAGGENCGIALYLRPR
jgi:hypothetical protein